MFRLTNFIPKEHSKSCLSQGLHRQINTACQDFPGPKNTKIQSFLGAKIHFPSYLHLCASVTKQYNLVPVTLFGWEGNCRPC